MAGKTREARIDELEQKLLDLKKQKQKSRLQVAVSVQTKRDLAPIFHGRKAGPIIVKEAEKLTLLQALRLLAAEDNSIKPADVNENGRKQPPTIIVSPSAELLEHAARWYIGPHILVRAAAVKIARKLKWMRERSRDEEYIEELTIEGLDEAEAEAS